MMPRAGRFEAALFAIVALASLSVSIRVLGTAANFDEATYTLTLRLLAAGESIGADVFASQPPLFYDLLRVFGVFVPDTVDGLRVPMIVLSLASLTIAYALGSTLAGRGGGVGAAALLAAIPFAAHEVPLVEAEPPSLLLALLSLLAAAKGFGRMQANRRAFLAGMLLAAAVLVKLLAATALVPLVALAVAQRATPRQLAATAAGAALVTAVTAVLHLNAIGELLHDAVLFHLDARETPFGRDDDLGRMHAFVHPREPATYLLLAGAAASFLPRNRRLWPLWTFAAAALAFTLVMEPLFDHHLVLLGTAAAVPAGAALGATVAALPRRTALAAAAAVAVTFAAAIAQLHGDAGGAGESRETRAAAAALRAGTASDDLVVADQPTVALLADRLVPGELVDTSAVRFATGSLTRFDVLAAAGSPGVGGAVAGRMFLAQPGLVRELAGQFPRHRRFGGITLYLDSGSPR
jgi:hypothetical protein